MDRRGFLRALGLGVAAAVAPAKTYAFFGNILRPKPALDEVHLWTPTYTFPPDFCRVWIVSSSWSNGREWGKMWFNPDGTVIRSEGGTIPDGRLVLNSGDTYEMTITDEYAS